MKKKNKLEKYESKVRAEPSPEQIKQAREWMLNRMMEVVDKLPANIQPVKESFAELARQAKFGIPRESTKIISAEATKIISAEPTKIISAEVTKTDSGKTTFTETEMEILRKIQNGE